MKVATSVFLALLAGVGMGYATTVAEFGLVTDLPSLDGPSPATRRAARAVVAEPVHDFGTLVLPGEGEHRFEIQNQGTADLKIEKKKTSCKCTISSLSREVIPPGESAEILVIWKTPSSWTKPKYVQTARIGTNDPLNPEISLRVEGRLVPEYRFADMALQFSPVSSHDSREQETRLYFYQHPQVQILDITGQQSEAAPYLHVTYRPLEADELEAERDEADAPGQTPQCGYLITTQLKPGLAPKRYFHAALFRTEPAMRQPPRLPISIKVQPAISLRGVSGPFHPVTRLLDMGTRPAGEAYTAKMQLNLVGDLRHDVAIEVQEVVPPQLEVTLGDPEELPNGTIRRPLHIHLPATAAPLSFLGGADGRLGHVVLATTHPHQPEVRFDVRVAVAGEGGPQPGGEAGVGGRASGKEAASSAGPR